ncbi:hypothetical protein GCM10010387_14560 [Streptomyces inusitatus]|uniref:Peptidase inhibitor family I36 n=1 Tax=Streptomyces inusitatus TaxID=68221 RepID=A0A918PT92_9ACTN|nr:peptidase inhibitor family I36 protein [Streptomyces inusitatus]GGZ22449.1 hypothetical protein GCM10010387_14560 [Streptomyces inusitatus]
MRTATTTAAAATALALAALLPTAAPAAATATATAAPAAAARLGECPPGALCLWAGESFTGLRQTHELYETGTDSCVPLPPGDTALSLANRTGRPVTVHQSPECEETGEFDTYPGSGVWTPNTPFQVRAFMVRES